MKTVMKNPRWWHLFEWEADGPRQEEAEAGSRESRGLQKGQPQIGPEEGTKKENKEAQVSDG